MTRFGFKKILSHCINSYEPRVTVRKSKSKQLQCVTESRQDDNISDHIEALDDNQQMSPRASEEVTNELPELKPTIRSQFVLGKVNSCNDYPLDYKQTKMNLGIPTPVAAARHRSRRPKLLRYLGGSCKLCPVCGQQEIDAGLPPDGQNSICAKCNAKIQGALDKFKGQRVTSKSRCTSGQAQWQQPPNDYQQMQMQCSNPTGTVNPSEPPPFSIVVLQDCENSALIDQLTTALARTCPQGNTQPAATYNNNNYNNDYNSNYNNDNYNNDYASGYMDNQALPNSGVPPQSGRPAYNPYNTNELGHVYYDDSQSRNYNGQVLQDNRSAPIPNDWRGNGTYNDDYPVQQNNRSVSPSVQRRNDFEGNMGYNNNYPMQQNNRTGTNAVPSSRSCRTQNDWEVNNDFPMQQNCRWADQQNETDAQSFKTSPKACTCNCNYCRKSQESNDKIVTLIVQALQVFLNNAQRESGKPKMGKKGKKATIAGKERPRPQVQAPAQDRSNACICGKTSVTKTSVQSKEKLKENAKEKLQPKAKERPKALSKDKPKGKRGTRQIDNPKFFLPESEQGRCTCCSGCPGSRCTGSGCPGPRCKGSGCPGSRCAGSGIPSSGCPCSGGPGSGRNCNCNCRCGCGCGGSRNAPESKASCTTCCQSTCSKSNVSTISGAPSVRSKAASKGGSAARSKQHGNGGRSQSTASSKQSSKSAASSKSPGNFKGSSCCPCSRQLDRIGAGDEVTRPLCGCCGGGYAARHTGGAGNQTNRCSQANRNSSNGNGTKGLQPVAHYRPGMLQFPLNYMLRRNGKYVRRSLVRTAAGATLHERPYSEEQRQDSHNGHPNSMQRFGCHPGFQFWH